MADVEFGYVYDFGAGEEFAARRGQGATLDGEAIAGLARDREAGGRRPRVGRPEWTLPALEASPDKAYRLRVVGSIAITAAYVAAGRFDAMLSLRSCRSVDAAAAQLIVREAGGAVAFGDLAPAEATLGPRRPLPAGGGLGQLLAGDRAGRAARRRSGVTELPIGFRNVCS